MCFLFDFSLGRICLKKILLFFGSGFVLISVFMFNVID